MEGTAKYCCPPEVAEWGNVEEPVKGGVEGIWRAKWRLFFLGGVLVVNDVEHGEKESRAVVGLETSNGLHSCCLVSGELLMKRCDFVDLEAPLRWDDLVKFFVGIPDLGDDSCNVTNMVELEFVPVVARGVGHEQLLTWMYVFTGYKDCWSAPIHPNIVAFRHWSRIHVIVNP